MHKMQTLAGSVTESSLPGMLFANVLVPAHPAILPRAAHTKSCSTDEQLWCALVPAAIEIRLVGWLKLCTLCLSLLRSLTIHDIQHQ